MRQVKEITVEVLREHLSYCKETGEFIWIKKTTPKSKGYVGEKAASKSTSGYLTTCLFGKSMYLHRIAWAMYYGEFPDSIIDHINRDRHDNRICNLRKVTYFENGQNRCVSSKNKSGIKGVYWCDGVNKWASQITCNKKKMALGYFSNIEDAATAYEKAASKFHSMNPSGVYAENLCKHKEAK